MEGGHTAVDALHAELLGTLLDVNKQMERLKAEIPTVKTDVEAFTANIGQTYLDLKKSTIELVGYIKHKQHETLGSLHTAQAAVTSETKKTLQGFERWIWLLAAAAGVNFVLLVAVIVLQVTGMVRS